MEGYVLEIKFYKSTTKQWLDTAAKKWWSL